MLPEPAACERLFLSINCSQYMTMMNDIQLLQQNERANELIFKGLVEFGCFKAALELDLFTHMAGSPKEAETLADDCQAIPSRFVMLLEALRQIGITLESDGKWSLTPLARAMFVPQADQPNMYMVPVGKAMAHLSENYYLKIADAVRGKHEFRAEVPYPPYQGKTTSTLRRSTAVTHILPSNSSLKQRSFQGQKTLLMSAVE